MVARLFVKSIAKCSDCPYLQCYGLCMKTQRIVALRGKTFPSWCPLPNDESKATNEGGLNDSQ